MSNAELVESRLKSFSWLGFFFAPYYYAGYGKAVKGIIMAVIGFIPLTSLIVAIYGGLQAKKELPVREQEFNWLHAIGVFVVHCLIMSAVSLLTPGGQKQYEEEIKLVKNSTMRQYPTVTIGNAFDASFDDGNWNSFQTDKKEQIVEFTGKISKGLHTVAVTELKDLQEQTLNPNNIQQINIRYQLFSFSLSYFMGKDWEYKKTKDNPIFSKLDKKYNCDGIILEGGNLPAPNCKDKEGQTQYVNEAIEELIIHFWETGTPVKVQWAILPNGKGFKVKSMESDSWSGVEYNKIMSYIFQ